MFDPPFSILLLISFSEVRWGLLDGLPDRRSLRETNRRTEKGESVLILPSLFSCDLFQ